MQVQDELYLTQTKFISFRYPANGYSNSGKESTACASPIYNGPLNFEHTSFNFSNIQDKLKCNHNRKLTNQDEKQPCPSIETSVEAPVQKQLRRLCEPHQERAACSS